VKRRTLLQSLATAFVARPLATIEAAAAPAQTGELSASQVATLSAIGEVVLPAAIGRDGREKAVSTFVAWIRNYREGADTGHSYGSSTLSRPTGASPAARYPAQFTALDDAARGQGAASFAALSVDRRRVVIEASLNTTPPVTRLPARPTGANLVADFMGLYFNSADAHDLCYQAEIRRDSCRTLEGSDQVPRSPRQ
jgi:hypothetical protein